MTSLSSMPMLGGVRLTPLPASVLPSTLSVEEPVEDDEHGGSYGEPYEIRHVRFVRSTEFSLAASGGAQGGYVFQEGSRGLVIVDAETSVGAREVAERSRVSVDGGDAMTVVKVTRCDHLDGSCHHWEVEVR